MNLVHFDTDFLVKAVSTAGPERTELLNLLASNVEVGMSAVAWYEFSRGQRTPEQLALASLAVDDDDIVSLDAVTARAAAETFRRIGSPRRRGNDIVIATTAVLCGATLWTLNPSDFEDIPGLELGP